jgi:hypothetical protein
MLDSTCFKKLVGWLLTLSAIIWTVWEHGMWVSGEVRGTKQISTLGLV